MCGSNIVNELSKHLPSWAEVWEGRPEHTRSTQRRAHGGSNCHFLILFFNIAPDKVPGNDTKHFQVNLWLSQNKYLKHKIQRDKFVQKVDR